MGERTNRQWRLASRPKGMVEESDFEMVETEVPALEEGQALIRITMLAFDPAMRGWLDDVESYLPPVGIGEVMRASVVGRVVESKTPAYSVGDWVTGTLGWQEYAIVDVNDPGMAGGARKLPAGATPEMALSVFGITGLTAYFGYLDVGKPRDGDVVLVSGAAGATGSVAAQIAKLKGASRVVGIAGGAEKCRWLVDALGLDAAIDYKNEDVGKRIREECPEGVDIFFDNVGGEILDSALMNMARGGRIVLCGGISGYNAESPPPGPSNYMQLVIRRCTMQGFIVIDYFGRMAEAIGDLSDWIAEGAIVAEVDVVEGFERAPACLIRLFHGQNRGKQLCRIAEA